MLNYKTVVFLSLIKSVLISNFCFATNGYNLWLNYKKINDGQVLNNYREKITSIYTKKGSLTLTVAEEELLRGMKGLLGDTHQIEKTSLTEASVIVATKDELPPSLSKSLQQQISQLSKDGFIIQTVAAPQQLIITANEDTGILYGVFTFLRLLQQHKPLTSLSIVESPKVDIRVLNHWDNLDRTVERGYAGFSIWNWHKLPHYIDQRYIDYARANASIGINGTVLTNVNANALVLTPQYLEKVKALAEVFRPYGIKVYLTARFSAPIETGGLKTADPLDSKVRAWWKGKVNEIYDSIPDFGGFLVKANSEGQPGPQNYGRTHVDGANMLADALAPHQGIVMWRAFVYSEYDNTDRAKQAYNEFVPFDGKFKDNVLLQVKNGPIDFQPREPFHPMFGAMPGTSLMMEFQVTQEYLGFSTHLVFLPKLFEETLSADTYQKGKGSTVAKVIDGSLYNKGRLTGMAGVANIGTAINWTGHPFAQANWYGFGRLAWDPYLSSEKIAEEWLRITFSNEDAFVEPMKDLLIDSRESVVNYMTPLGLHHLMGAGHHYGPGPWVSNMPRADWTSVYYHKADSMGIGFDRTPSGSVATKQYATPLAKIFEDPARCPEKYLLWFHHLSWDYKLKNKKSLWYNLAFTYQLGVDEVKEMSAIWQKMRMYVNTQRFEEVQMLLQIQLKEAQWWKNACLLYFQQFSQMPFPEGVEKPKKPLAYYQSLKFPYAPGIRPSWN